MRAEGGRVHLKCLDCSPGVLKLRPKRIDHQETRAALQTALTPPAAVKSLNVPFQCYNTGLDKSILLNLANLQIHYKI